MASGSLEYKKQIEEIIDGTTSLMAVNKCRFYVIERMPTSCVFCKCNSSTWAGKLVVLAELFKKETRRRKTNLVVIIWHF